MTLLSTRILRIVAAAACMLATASTFQADAQTKPLTAADFPKTLPKFDESLRAMAGKNFLQQHLLAPYDGTALRMALEEMDPALFRNRSIDALISELSALRIESMSLLLPQLSGFQTTAASGRGIFFPADNLTKRTDLIWLPLHPLSFFSVVMFENQQSQRDISLNAQKNSKAGDYSLTGINEYEIVGEGMTVNVREEIQKTSDARYVGLRKTERTTIELNEASKTTSSHTVERGIIESGSDEIQRLHPRQLRLTSSHRVTIEMINDAKVARCPDAAGLSAGETFSSVSIRSTAAAMANGSPSFTQTVTNGKVTGFVNDMAQLTGFDWKTSSELRYESLNEGENMQLGEAFTWRARNIDATFTLEGEMNGKLSVGGVGTDEKGMRLLKLEAASSTFNFLVLFDVFREAETYWQGGNCIELVVKSGASPAKLKPGESRQLLIEAKHKFEPPPIKIPVVAKPLGGTISPATPPHTPAAQFLFTADPKGKGNSFLQFSSVSRMGKAKELSLAFDNGKDIPIKVEISYFENETQILKRASLPGVEVEGGDMTSSTTAAHTAIFYHFPDPSDLEDGYLIDVDGEDPDPGSTTYIKDEGYYEYRKTEADAILKGKVKDLELVRDTEKAVADKTISAFSSPKYRSSLVFMKPTENEPARVEWNVLYPASKDGTDFTIENGMSVSRGDEGVKWTERKITDPNSRYKTEYLIKVRLDAAEELKKDNKALKDYLGFDANDLPTILNPTAQQQPSVIAAGSRSLTLRILSPYPAD